MTGEKSTPLDISTLCQGYERRNTAKAFFLWACILMLAAAMLAGLFTGASAMGVAATIQSVFTDTGQGHDIVWGLRLPRVVLGVLAGLGLGVAGAVFQVVLRNPLASPMTLGIGSGAGFGAVAVIVFLANPRPFMVALGALVFSFFSACFILAVSRIKRATPETMILAGIAQMFLANSLTSLLQYTGTMDQVHEIMFWFFGSLSKAGWKEIGMTAVMVLAPMPLLYARAWDFNLLAGGDDTAASLGLSVSRFRMQAVAAASVVTAGSICFIGVIGFVGLVSPHIARMVIGNDHRFLIPVSGLLGAVMVTAADVLGRTLWAPQIIPIGIVTSLIGVPFFFYLLMRRSREFW